MSKKLFRVNTPDFAELVSAKQERQTPQLFVLPLGFLPFAIPIPSSGIVSGFVYEFIDLEGEQEGTIEIRIRNKAAQRESTWKFTGGPGQHIVKDTWAVTSGDLVSARVLSGGECCAVCAFHQQEG